MNRHICALSAGAVTLGLFVALHFTAFEGDQRAITAIRDGRSL